MRFTKMHGAGNDYVYISLFDQDIEADWPTVAREVSDRRRGIGADGLILILPSERADGRMRIFNADGSEAEMCGNGLRCVAKYLLDCGHAQDSSLSVETNGGVLQATVGETSGMTSQVRTDLGQARLDASEIPTTIASGRVVDHPLKVDNRELRVTCVSLSNPHCVVFVDQASDELVLGLGPQIERASVFPERTNVEFVEVISPRSLKQRTWERGSGETWACGTGAAAVCVAGVLSGRTQRQVKVELVGGTLQVEWDKNNNHVYVTGPATEVFAGEWKSY